MGTHPNIDLDKFPKQGRLFGKKVQVCFHYNSSDTVNGKVVRDDAEDPFVTIIKLSDGRFVLDSECQYHVVGS